MAGVGFLRRIFGSGETQPKLQGTEFLIEPEREDATLEVVGESNYQEHLLVVAGGRTRDGPANPEQIAVLVPEPRNQYDPNAVSVRISGRHVGYLSREEAIRYAQPTRLATSRNLAIAIHARLIGGWDRGSGDKGSIGVVLHIGSPAECMLNLLGEAAPKPRTDHRWVGWMIAFTGDSRCSVAGFALDREASIVIAQRAGMTVHPRVTKKVQLLVDCDPRSTSGNESRALQHGIPVVSEAQFWTALGISITSS